MNKKVLILTYYWPPSGGAGVQRWLKLSHYLQQQGFEVHVIVPRKEDASYFAFDETLVHDINPNIHIHPTKTIEPFGLYKKLFGKESIPSSGFSNVNPNSLKQQLSLFLRSNLFIPDPRKYWKRFAYKKAKQLISKHGITTVITSSPPHSVQLIGDKLKRKLNIYWIADFRDMWTDVYYYKLLKHSSLSHWINKNQEKKVLERADHIVTASEIYNPFFIAKSKKSETKFTSIPNGYDTRDFKNYSENTKTDFIISYTGSISKQYKIGPFLEALAQFKEKITSEFKLRFVGATYPQLQQELADHGLADHTKFEGYVPHEACINYLEDSAVLLVLGPLNSANAEGGIPAKVYEYLAANKPILYIGKTDGFVAKILKETNAGQSFDTDVQLILNYLQVLHNNWKNSTPFSNYKKAIVHYSREAQAQQFGKLIK